ncbi:MAG TPA: hypothetical protein VGK17_19850 [Propionicimonas sp.]|jgi:hypothetical protein
MFETMDWPALWTAATTGVVAAFVAFSTAAYGYRRTRRDDRRDAATRARAARIGKIQSAVHGDLAVAMSWRWLPVGSDVLKVAQAISEFASAELVDHPAVALWSMERLESMGPLARKAERFWLLPGDSKRRAELVRVGVEIATALAAWQSGAAQYEWFEANLSKQGQETVAALAAHRRQHRSGASSS